MKTLKLLLCSAFVFSAVNAGAAVSNVAAAHEGELDSMGCHYARSNRNYHCHEGTFAGMTFRSKGQAIRDFHRLRNEAEKDKGKE